MIDVISVKAMRESDAATIAGGIPGRELMRRAGKGIFECISWRAPVAIVCGSGNNGGDGYVIAALLCDSGIECTLFLLSDRFSEDGRYYYDVCAEKGIPVRTCDGEVDFSGYATVVDCILGTGFGGAVRDPIRRVITAINAARRSGAYVVSVDINSGLCGDNGRAEFCVQSDLTVSVGTYQPGHFLNGAKDAMHTKCNVAIGIAPIVAPYGVLEDADAAGALPVRRHDANKSTYGYVALVGGSECYSGAIRLAALAEASMRSGAGVTMIAAPRSLSSVILPAILESTFYPLSEKDGMLAFCAEELDRLMKRVKVIAFGMGIGNGRETERAVEHLLCAYTGTLVLDADGLNALARLPRELLRESGARIVLTPHPLEFARISGRPLEAVLDDPIGCAREYAEETGTVVLLKGPTTVVTDGERVLLSDRGCPGMATAGSGDVLSGILASLCGAGGEDLLLTVAAAAYINGYAGELAERESCAAAMTAGDTARAVKQAVTELYRLRSDSFQQ